MKLIITITLGLFLVACQKTDCDNIRYESSDFQFTYPCDWRKAVIGNSIVAHVEESHTPQKFRDDGMYISTNFAIEKIISSVNELDEYAKQYEEELLKNEVFKDAKILSKNKVKFSGNNAMEYICDAKIMNINVTFRLIILIKNGNIYKLSTRSRKNRYRAMAETTDLIFQSFKLK